MLYSPDTNQSACLEGDNIPTNKTKLISVMKEDLTNNSFNNKNQNTHNYDNNGQHHFSFSSSGPQECNTQ